MKSATKKPQPPAAEVDNPPPTVAHDLDWFAFENRIRSTVFQLIDPLQNK